MFQTILFGLIIIPRTSQIVKRLHQHHNFDIDADPKTINFIMGMVLASPLNNEEITNEVLEMFSMKKNSPTNK